MIPFPREDTGAAEPLNGRPHSGPSDMHRPALSTGRIGRVSPRSTVQGQGGCSPAPAPAASMETDQ